MRVLPKVGEIVSYGFIHEDMIRGVIKVTYAEQNALCGEVVSSPDFEPGYIIGCWPVSIYWFDSERDAAIKEIADELCFLKDQAARLYDAGYRKEVK